MAIALDTTSNFDGPGGAHASGAISNNHTCTGSNLIMFVGIATNVASGPDCITSVTYNGVGLTQVGKVAFGAFQETYLYYLIAPATGTNSVTVNYTDPGFSVAVATYTGAEQGSAHFVSTTNGPTTTTALTTSVVTTADNSWSIICAQVTNTPSAGTGTTLRKGWASGTFANTAGLYDSNGAITPAGSTSLQTTSANGAHAHVMAAFAPNTALATAIIHDSMLMGAGL